MIVRAYGRRSRGTSSTALDDDVEDPYSYGGDDVEKSSYSMSQGQETSQEMYNFTFSSQDSTRWTFDSEPYVSNSSENVKSKSNSLQLLAPIDDRARKLRKLNTSVLVSELRPTATLMETQEHGEMMECVDEVDFALDGLRNGQGVRVRRASLLSLLNVCGIAPQRRLLKAQGLVETIIDAIFDLSLDDEPGNLAAATLFYILTCDGQDNYLLDSSSSIRFLLKLLKPVAADAAVDKAPSISQKLLALQKEIRVSQGDARRLDSSSTAITHKVLETLVSCKDLKAGNMENIDMSRPELNSNWISLLTMEKACLSTISIEDTTGSARKIGGNFKEKLRDLGGLDAVFELAINCFSTLEGFIEHGAASTREPKDGNLQCFPLLLKCLKIMENATFLSEGNQSHLLRLKGNLTRLGSSLPFVKLMINFINILSEKTSVKAYSPEMLTNKSNGGHHYPEFLLSAEQKVDRNGIFTSQSSQECSSTGRYSSDAGLSTSQSSQGLFNFRPGSVASNFGVRITSGAGNSLMQRELSSSVSGSCSLTSSSDCGPPGNGQGSKMKWALGKSSYDNDEPMCIDLEESQDPFAFDEDDFVSTKWDKPSGRRKGGRKQKSRLASRDADDGCISQPLSSQEECLCQPMVSQEGFCNEEANEGNHHSSDTSCTTAIDKENSDLVADCLLTAIKVLMNLTNDNAIGCQQIAACGGLETISSLIARHFPAFSSSPFAEVKENSLMTNAISEPGSQIDVHLSDQELDFLVTILGLLVNMVENDGHNRSRLAAARVSLPCSGGSNEVKTGVIPLLCSIFLSNRGAGEAAEELQSLDDEEVVLQGEKEAEKMIVEAYAALLLAFLSTESTSIRKAIANYLPDHSLKVLAPVLERFVTFHLTLNMISPETHRTVSEVIESCKLP